jgi:HlyD family type I secretion membrane fusion protein
VIRILIVDDQKTIRKHLTTVLEQEPNIELVGTVEDGYAAFERVIELHPDIVLIDMMLPGMDGISTAQIISQNYPEIKLIAWSAFDSQDLVTKFLRIGGKGYLLKDTPVEELVSAIALVNKGYIQISPSLTSKTERNISGEMEFIPVTANSKLEASVESAPKTTNESNNWVNRLKNTFIATKQNSDGELNLVTTTPAPIVTSARSIIKSTTVPIEANELLPSVSNWTILGGLATVSAIAIATMMATVTQYKVIVNGDATVRPTGELRLVQAATDGIIIDLTAKLNQAVKRGDILATLDSSQLNTQIERLQTSIQQAQLQSIQIEAQINALKSQMQAEIDKIERNLASAKAGYHKSLREYQDRQITTVAEVEEAQANLKLAQDELTRYQKLVDSGAISQLQLTEKQAAYNTAQARLKRVKTALNPSNAEVEIAAENIAQQQATGQATLANLNKERQGLIQQKTEIERASNRDRSSLKQLETDLKKTKITATTDGIISKLNLRNLGQTVKLGEEIAQIVPSNSAIEIKAKITPQDISKVRLKQPVDLRISACPYPDYGTLSGIVSNISADALANSNNNSLLSTNKTFYEVTIVPDNLVLIQGNKQCPLQLGMEGRADIITAQETVWQFILRKARLNTNL